MSENQDARNAAMTSHSPAGNDVAALRREIAKLQNVVRDQGAMIACLKQENERQQRSHNWLSAHVSDEFARAFLWLDAIACKAVPEALMMATEVCGRVACEAGTTVPPHRLSKRAQGRPC